MKNGFFIAILFMGGMLILRGFLDPPKKEVKKDYYYEYKNMEPTWNDPKNVAHIKNKYHIK